MKEMKTGFPDGFLWGGAIAANQAEVKQGETIGELL